MDFGDFPGVGFGQQRSQQAIIKRMARFVGDISSQKRMPQHVKVTHRVQNLVLHKFVVGTKSAHVKHAELIHHDGVFKRAALGKSHRSEQLHFGHEAESARTTDGLLIGFKPQIHHGMLHGRVNRRMTESNRKIENHAVVRLQTRPFVAIAHFDRLFHAYETARHGLLQNAGATDEIDKSRTGTVHDRDFRRIHFNDEELRVLAKTGTGVAHCPISNMKLSSGIARIPEMLELGVPVGLAVDGSASNDGSSLMEELRVAFLLHRLNASRRAPTGYDVLKMATRGSARLLGRDDIGQLAVGKCADLFMIDSRRLELVGSCFDPKSVLGTVGVRGPVDYTVVHGRVTVAQGHLMTVDEERLAQDAETCCRQYLAR